VGDGEGAGDGAGDGVGAGVGEGFGGGVGAGDGDGTGPGAGDGPGAGRLVLEASVLFPPPHPALNNNEPASTARMKIVKPIFTTRRM